jgi:hypothetical protein
MIIKLGWPLKLLFIDMVAFYRALIPITVVLYTCPGTVSLVVSAGKRWAQEGYFEGTNYDANSLERRKKNQ